jgi:hypothetical protein
MRVHGACTEYVLINTVCPAADTRTGYLPGAADMRTGCHSLCGFLCCRHVDSISITRCGSWRITTRRNLGGSPRTVGPARPKPQTLTRSTRRKVTEAPPLGSCHTRSPHPDSRGDVSSQHRSREQHRHLPVGCRLDWLVLEWTGECPSHDTPCSIPARCSPTFKIGPHHMRLILSQRSLLLPAACHTSHPYPTLP